MRDIWSRKVLSGKFIFNAYTMNGFYGRAQAIADREPGQMGNQAAISGPCVVFGLPGLFSFMADYE